MTSSLPSAVPLAILQAEYMAKKSKERSSQSTCNEEWCRIQPPASMIHWSAFHVSPLKKLSWLSRIFGVGLRTWVHLLSPDFWLFWRKQPTFLPTLALDHWLLSSKQLNLSSVTTILHYSLMFMLQKLFYIIYNKRKLYALFFLLSYP